MAGKNKGGREIRKPKAVAKPKESAEAPTLMGKAGGIKRPK